MVTDLRYARRVLVRDYGFATVAILTLALGIGANTAIFTVVNALLLRPLPYPQSNLLVTLYGTNPKRAVGRGPFSLMRLDQLRTQTQSFSSLAGSCSESCNLTGVDQPQPGLDLLATDLSAFSQFTREQIRHGAGYISAIARLNPSVNIRQANAEMEVLARPYLRDNDGKVDADPDARMVVAFLKATVVEDVKPALLILCAAVGAVLLIACANIASLLLARASIRQKELAVRAALGASRSDLVRHLLAESLLLSFTGGVLGLFLASTGTRLLATNSQLNLPRIQEVQLDWQALTFTVVISLLTGVFFGWIPTLQVSRPELNAILRESSRGTSASLRRNRTRSLLVIGQVALSMVLLIAASLLTRSFLALQRVDLGFDARNVLTMQVSLPALKYRNNAQQNAFFEQVLARISAVPGVHSASASLWLPLTSIVVAPVQRADDTPLPFGMRPFAYWQGITPDYFRAMNIRLMRGRFFTEHDNAVSAGAAIVNESMARRLCPNQDPIGKQLIIARAEIHAEVVGVVADVKANAIDRKSGSEMYSPYAQRPWPSMSLAVRTSGEPLLLSAAVRYQIHQVDRDLPLIDVRTMENIVAQSFGQRRVTLWLFGAFAVSALLLAAIGIMGCWPFRYSSGDRKWASAGLSVQSLSTYSCSCCAKASV